MSNENILNMSPGPGGMGGGMGGFDGGMGGGRRGMGGPFGPPPPPMRRGCCGPGCLCMMLLPAMAVFGAGFAAVKLIGKK